MFSCTVERRDKIYKMLCCALIEKDNWLLSSVIPGLLVFSNCFWYYWGCAIYIFKNYVFSKTFYISTVFSWNMVYWRCYSHWDFVTVFILPGLGKYLDLIGWLNLFLLHGQVPHYITSKSTRRTHSPIQWRLASSHALVGNDWCECGWITVPITVSDCRDGTNVEHYYWYHSSSYTIRFACVILSEYFGIISE